VTKNRDKKYFGDQNMLIFLEGQYKI